jgi:hypothetical protein
MVCSSRTSRTVVSVLLCAFAIFPRPLMARNRAFTAAHSSTSQMPPKMKEYEQFVAYWSAESGWQSELQLRNNMVAQDLTVSPVLRTSDGTETPLPAVTVKPAEVKSIDIDMAAPQLAGQYGSILLKYRAVGLHSLYAALMIHDAGHPIVFHLDAMAEAQNFDGVSREGIWWFPNATATDYLVITNQAGAAITYDLSLFDAAGSKSYKQTLAIGPRQTNRYSLRHLIRSAGLNGPYGGIKILAHSHSGSLDSVHFIFDEQAEFSALLKMFDYDPRATVAERDHARTRVWTLRAPMLALSQPDPALALPSATVLQPKILVRNATGKSSVVATRFNWRSLSVTGHALGPVFTLSPFETQLIDIAQLQDAKTLPKEANWTSVVLTTNGRPDEVMAVAASYDKTLRYGAQTPFSDQLGFAWEGGRWEYDAQHDSIVTGGNGATKPVQAAFTIFYNQGAKRYELQQTLQPDEQMWIDVGRLIRERTPDKNGKVLPIDLESGSYEFRELNAKGIGHLFEGKVIYDKTFGHAAYGCATVCCYNNPYLTYDPLGIPLSATSGNGVDTSDNCGGLPIDVTGDFGDWNTADHSIATVNYSGVHTGVAAGSTSTTASGELDQVWGRNSCTVQSRTVGGGDNVAAIPTNFHQSSVSPLGNGVLQFNYEWSSSSGKLSDLSNCTVGETVNYPGTSNPYLWASPPYASTATSNPTTTSFTATSGAGTDQHGHPNFLRPYTSNNFNATQNYRFQCTNYQNAAWITMMGPLTINRAISQNSNGTWQYVITKSGSSDSVNPLP